MDFERTYSLSKADHVSGLRAIVQDLRAKDPNIPKRFYETLALCVALGVAAIWLVPGSFIAIIVALAAIWILGVFLERRWGRRSLGITYDPDLMTNIILEFTGRGITQRDAYRERRWIWESVTKVHKCADVIVVQLIGHDMIVLPQRLWSDPREREAFVASLQAQAECEGRNKDPAPLPSTNRIEVALVAGLMALAAMSIGGIVLALPLITAPNMPAGIKFAAVASILVVSAIAAWLTGRAATRGLARLERASPRFAMVLTAVLVWALPGLLLLAYLFDWWRK